MLWNKTRIWGYVNTFLQEIAFREYESACEQSPDCASKTGPARFACIRHCISPSCHQELYATDPLEEGEIDVRLNSFKGCFIQRLSRPRQWKFYL